MPVQRLSRSLTSCPLPFDQPENPWPWILASRRFHSSSHGEDVTLHLGKLLKQYRQQVLPLQELSPLMLIRNVGIEGTYAP